MLKFKVRSGCVKLCVVILALRQHKASLTEGKSQRENLRKEFRVFTRICLQIWVKQETKRLKTDFRLTWRRLEVHCLWIWRRIIMMYQLMTLFFFMWLISCFLILFTTDEDIIDASEVWIHAYFNKIIKNTWIMRFIINICYLQI